MDWLRVYQLACEFLKEPLVLDNRGGRRSWRR